MAERSENNMVEDLSKNLSKLSSDVRKLDSDISKSLSFKYLAYTGIVRGFFTVLGATVIFAIVIFIADKTLQNLESVPVLETIIDKLPLERLIDSAKNGQ